MSNKRIFLDHAAGKQNPNSLHQEGRQSRAKLAQAKKIIANYIKAASPNQIIFAPSASLVNHFLLSEFHNVAASAIEHQSILSHQSVKKLIPVNEAGIVSGQTLQNIEFGGLSERGVHAPIPSRSAVPAPRKDGRAHEATAKSKGLQVLLSISLANHEIGTIQDIKTLAKLAQDSGTLFHTDASAALTKIPINVQKLNIDYLTLSGLKIGIPGIAVLYAKNPTNNLQKFPVGTPNIPAISKLAQILEKNKNLPKIYETSVRPLRDHLAHRLTTEISGTTLNGNQSHSLPNLLNLSFAGAEGESILALCDLAGIAVSTGSACALGAPSHVIEAITGDPVAAHNSVRISLSPETTREQIDIVADQLKQIIAKLREYTTCQ